MLRAGPLRPEVLADRTDLDVAATLCLLRAAVPLDLIEAPDAAGAYGLGATGASLLGNSAALAMVAHHDLLYADLTDPVALLRGEAGATRLQRFWAYADDRDPAALSAARAVDYSQLMSVSQPLVHATVLDAVDLRAQRQLLDVGGGVGAFALAAARRFPQLQGQVFDLPAVAALARSHIAAAGLSARIAVCSGNFLVDPLPTGADVLSFVRVLHDHDDGVVRRLLRGASEALPPGGRLLVAEPLAGTPSAPRVGDAYFGFYLRAMGQGRPRTADDYVRLIEAAGFRSVRRITTALPLACGLLTAIRPDKVCCS
jgi:demethylspheroidene O-methyltransferase